MVQAPNGNPHVPLVPFHPISMGTPMGYPQFIQPNLIHPTAFQHQQPIFQPHLMQPQLIHPQMIPIHNKQFVPAYFQAPNGLVPANGLGHPESIQVQPVQVHTSINNLSSKSAFYRASSIPVHLVPISEKLSRSQSLNDKTDQNLSTRSAQNKVIYQQFPTHIYPNTMFNPVSISDVAGSKISMSTSSKIPLCQTNSAPVTKNSKN